MVFCKVFAQRLSESFVLFTPFSRGVSKVGEVAGYNTLWYIYNSLPSYCGIFMIPSLIVIPLWYIYDSLPIHDSLPTFFSEQSVREKGRSY